MLIAADVKTLFGVTVEPMASRPDRETWHGDEVYELAYLFCTRDGSWEPDPGWPGSIDQWARDRFLKAPDDPEYCSAGGGDHNMFGAVIGQDGKLMRGKGMLWWSQGYAALGTPGLEFVTRNTDERGWCDIPVWQSYSPERGEQGPWCQSPVGLADVVRGGGMPWNWHVSFFGVWRAKPAGAVVVPPVDPGEPPVSGDLAAILAEVRGIRADLRLIYRGLP